MNPEKIFEDNNKDEYFERVVGDSDYQKAEKLWKEDLERMEQEKELIIEFNLEEKDSDNTFVEKDTKEQEVVTFKNKEKEGSEKLFIELKKKENEEKRGFGKR